MPKALLLAALAVLTLASCQSHPTLRYAPHEYAKLRDIELLTTPPARPYRVLSTVEASGGRRTAVSTMINSMIDTAGNAGADALIPLDFDVPGKRGLELFVRSEDGRIVTRGRAIRWERSALP